MIIKVKRDSVYLVLLVLFLFSYPFTFNLSAFSVILLTLFFFIDSKECIRQKLNKLKGNKLFYGFVIYFFIQCLGMINTDNLAYGFKQLNIILPFLVLPAVILSEKLETRNKERLFSLLKIWMVISLVVLTIVQIFFIKKPIIHLNNFAYAYLGTSQIYISSFLFVLTMHSIQNFIKKNKRALNLFFILYFGFFMLIFASRSIIIVFSIAMVYMIFIQYKDFFNRKLKIVLLLCFTLFLTLALVFSQRVNRKIKTFLRTSDFNIETIITKNSITHTHNTVEHRVLIDYLAFQIIKEHPLFGVGTGDFQEELYKKYKAINFKYALTHKLNTHNQYLQEYLKTGILGFLFFTCLLMFLLKKAYKKQHNLFYVTMLIAVYCLFESYIARQHGVLFMAFFLSYYYSEDKRTEVKIALADT